MELSDFITALLHEGKVTVQGELISFDQQDLAEANNLLFQYYHEDKLEMPFSVPAYSEEAAVWAAQYFYTATQLTVIRDLGEDVINEKLLPFGTDITPSVIYSADLIFRYLPVLTQLAKGLAPADKLVEKLKKIAIQFPFSSVGMDLDNEMNDSAIFLHPSLKYAYFDRILRHKDKSRVVNATVKNHIYEVTGEHLFTIWPDFQAL
jgi:hypothetical protein